MAGVQKGAGAVAEAALRRRAKKALPDETTTDKTDVRTVRLAQVWYVGEPCMELEAEIKKACSLRCPAVSFSLIVLLCRFGRWQT